MGRIHLLSIMVILAAFAAVNPGSAAPWGGDEYIGETEKNINSTFPVIAEGVATISTDDVAWRLVRDVAQMPGEAEDVERALGFVLATATDGDVLVTDVNAGVETPLATGEASFVAEGAVERRESLGEEPVPYYRFALVPPEDADYTAGGELVHAGEPFAAPEEPRAIQLLGGTLQPDQSVGIPNTGFPSLLLVTEGKLLVDFATGGDPVPLHAGEAVAIGGAIGIAAAEEPAAFAAAIIGEPASDGDGGTPTGEGTDSSDTVQVVVTASACPQGGDDLNACDLQPLEGVTIEVLVDGSEIEGSPFTTEMTSIGPNVKVDVPVDATLTLTELDGLPDGYGPAIGHDPLTVEVADLEERSCGGEDVCRYVDLINLLSGPVDGSTPVGDTGSLVVFASDCPAKVTGDPANPCPGEATPLPDMMVGVYSAATGETIPIFTNDQGQAGPLELPAGVYDVHFSPATISPVTGVCGGQDSSADLPVVTFTEETVTIEIVAGKEYDCVAYAVPD